jgi:hypothetical protein
LITVETFEVKREHEVNFTGKKFETISERTKLTHEVTGDNFIINTSTYNQLKEKGDSDIKIFEYIESVMKD